MNFETQKFVVLGDNVEVTETDGHLILKVALDTPGTLSRSEKSMNLATTRGNKTLNTSKGQVTVGLNIYTPVSVTAKV